MMDHRIIQIQSNGTTGGNHHSNNGSNQNFNSIITNFHNNNNNTTNSSSSSSCSSNSMTAFTTNTTSQQSLMSSKLLVLHPDQLNDNYPEVVNDGGGGGNGVGNIVLLATEQMDISNADHDVINNNILNGVANTNGAGGGVNTDEELTPLTWLHDKNLLKGINLSCAKVQSSPESQQMTAPLSPTSDFVEDSCVSEDNISSTNSTSDQSIGVYCTESPTKSTYSLTYHTSSLMKNRRQSPSLMSTTSTSSEIGSPVYEHHYNSSADSKLLSSPASTMSIASTNSYSSSTTPHQHFHKKYLREEHVKVMRESGASGGHNDHNLLAIKQEYVTVKLEAGDNNNHLKSEYCSSPSPTYEMTSSYDRMVGNVGQSNKGVGNSREAAALANNNNTSSNGGGGNNNSKSANSQKQKHPTNVPYDPLVHITSKPPYSFSSLIFMAIEDSQQKALPVKEIYAWIVMHFPYFKTAPTGWKNSVRHNLSLNKCFQKVEKAANLGKGSLWMVENQFRPNLLQALTRSPFHPCSTLDKNAYANKNVVTTTARTTTESPPTVMKTGSRLPDPQHFPFLAKRLAAMEDDQRGDQDSTSRSSTPTLDDEGHVYGYGGEQRYTSGGYATDSQRPLPVDYTTATTLSTDSSIEDVNAATAMLALKHGPKIFGDSFASNGGNPPVITSSPSEDHTYSAGISVNGGATNGAVDGVIVRAAVNGGEQLTGVVEYDSNDEGHHTLQTDESPLPDSESEEQRRHAEGVDALLNLAGITNYSTANTITSPVQTGATTTTTTTYLLKRPASLNLDDGHVYKHQIQFHREQPQQQQQQQQNGSDSQYGAQQQYVLSAPTPAKKLKTSSNRSLKSRFKKKSWLR